MILNFENALALECRAELQRRSSALRAEGHSPDYEDDAFSAQLNLYTRILGFPFDRYPDYTAPWHLLLWEHMRWEHVYHVVQILESLRQPTGSKVGGQIKLQPFQIMILLCFLGPEEPDTGLRLVREGLLTLARKQGKLLRLDEPIPTPRGWVRNGDLEVGDEVFGGDGRPCRVLEAFPTEVPEAAYRLTFSDGTSVEAGAEHQWLTRHRFRPWVPPVRKSSGNGMSRRPVESVVTTEQIAKSLVIERSDGRTEWNHSIRLCGPAQYPERDLPIEPYLLGIWLAEGNVAGSRVTLADQDADWILGRLRLRTVVKKSCSERGACVTYRIGAHGTFVTALRDLGVLGNKHIPERYLTASLEQRRALIQGLIDGDGHCQQIRGASSTVEVTTKFQDLAGGILELVRSLGLKPISGLNPGTIDGVVVGHYHRIQFTAYQEDAVASLPRKLNALKPRPETPTRASRKQIVSCERVESSPMRCIAVDSPGNLYLAGRDYTVTHNTAIVAGLATALMCLHPDDHGLAGQEIQVGAADREQAGITHMMCERYVTLDNVLGISEKFRSVPSKKTLTHNSTLTTLKCLSSDAYRHLGGNPVMVLMDEIGNVPGSAAEEFYSALTTGYGAQDEPLTLLLSTQAPNDQHFFSQQVDRAKRVNEGMLDDDQFAGFVFTVPETDPVTGEDVDPFDPDLWYLAAPGIDTIYNRQDMVTWAKKARELPSLQNRYENLKLNRRVSETSAFLSRTVWARNSPSFDMEQLVGKDCTLGLDLSETTDLTALVAVFEPMELRVNGVIEMRQPVLPMFWIPGEGLAARSHRDKVPYDVWAGLGLIDVSSARTVDYKKVAEKILEWMDIYEVIAIGFDRWKMKYLLKELNDLGLEFFDEEEEKNFLIPIGQGFQGQSRSVELMEEKAVNAKLAHSGHPILTWNVGNAVTIHDPAGNRKFSKAEGHSFGRIDGCVATALAIHARSEFEVDGEEESAFNTAAPDEIIM